MRDIRLPLTATVVVVPFAAPETRFIIAPIMPSKATEDVLGGLDVGAQGGRDESGGQQHGAAGQSAFHGGLQGSEPCHCNRAF